MHDTAIGRIVGRQEVVLVARTSVDVTIGHKETSAFEVQISIDISPGITTNIQAGVCVLLNSKLVELRQIVRSLVLGEIGYTTAQFDCEDTGNYEFQIEV